ncbi:MAG: hypothetical protein CL720_04970 [Chloroflexi bacterium]|jgi:hypothetical protein|nr:hypothetical protein [Chloroflexota bacterium]|tara:strand:- start:1422 stop:1724 length:303 start_codon:yes stop_codon:yes gene_type:complete
MRYTTKSRKGKLIGEYEVTVTDTENVKPTVTVMVWTNGESPAWCKWRIADPVYRFKGTDMQVLDYDDQHCCGFESKKEAIRCLQRDGAHIDENTVTDSMR